MSLIIINSDTRWSSLPWTQINEKIYVIQRKVYQYSRDCNKKNLHRLQNYIINSSDAKVLAVQKVLDSIEQYYLINNQEKYIFNDMDKLLIYENLSSKILYNTRFDLILDKIKQYLIYLCISPEWEAKLEPTYKLGSHKQSEYYFIERLNKFIFYTRKISIIRNHIYYINHKTINKFIDINHLVNKMQSLKSIQHYIKYWLQNQDSIESLHNKFDIQKLNVCFLFNKIIYQIIFNGIEWFSIVSLQNNIKRFNLLKYFFILFDNSNCHWIFINPNLYRNSYLNSIYIFCKFISLNYISYNKVINTNYYVMYDYVINQQNKDNNLLTIQLKTNFYKNLLKEIKYILYHKDILGRWRLNNRRALFKCLNQINIILICFCRLYNPIINLINIGILFNSIDKLIIQWIRKNNQNLLLYYQNKKYLIKYLILNNR